MISKNIGDDSIVIKMISEDGTNFLQASIDATIRGRFLKIYNDDIFFGENCLIDEFGYSLLGQLVGIAKEIEGVSYIDINILKDNAMFDFLNKHLENNNFQLHKNNLNSIWYRYYI